MDTKSSANHLWSKEWKFRESVSVFVVGKQEIICEFYLGHMGKGGSLQ